MTALHAVRFRDEFEMRCEVCDGWWPMSPEFWYPRRGVSRCLACLRDKDAVWRRTQRPRPAQRRKTVTWQSALRKRLQGRAAQARYYRGHADEVRAKRRAAYYAAKVAA